LCLNEQNLKEKQEGAWSMFLFGLGCSFLLNLLGGISAADIFERLVGGKYIG
jgi:hypothetical protein